MQKLTLKALRANANLTQRQVADALGIVPSTWSKWELGKSYPDIVDLKKIEDFFNISYNDIYFF